MQDQSKLAERVVERMYSQDWFSQWLGIERVLVEPGKCILKMSIRKEMLNGFSIAHGGITFSLADSALAFAANSHGQRSVSVETSISHTEPLMEHDEIIATAHELNRTNKIAIYQVTVSNQHGRTVALFKGTVYRTSKEWFPEEK
ncbi:MAG: hotdog fold thioesterase [Bacteroidia bacterium]|nr:hotdog fold thioesterase [Bacteroidia bacterium]